ncbi:MAG: amidohydrolase family protein [Pseudomonadota bacterium]
MDVDVLIKNGRIVTHSDEFDGAVAIKGEKIAAIVSDPSGINAKKTVDAKGNVVMPGNIDPHVHIALFMDFDTDMKSETGAAAAGGTTTVMHCLLEKESILTRFPVRNESIEKCSYTDIAFYAAIMSETHIQEIEKTMDLGICSFKFLMGYKGKAGEEIGILGADSRILFLGFEKLAKLGGLPMIHAEHIEMIYAIEPRYKQDNTLKTWWDARPNVAEEIDMRIAASIAEFTGSRLYQVHTSVGTVAEIYKPFRERGVKIYSETCPHYLVLDAYGKMLKNPLLAKINPPIRGPEDCKGLWKALQDGTVDCIGTDSCNSMWKDKWQDGNIWKIYLDFSSVETMLPLLISEGYHKGRLTMPQIVKYTSYNTAHIHGLAPKKGIMAPGSDADITIVDLNKKKTITPDIMHSIAEWNVYEGWEITGWPVLTMVRGQVVYEDEKLVGKPGYGRFVPCKPQK